MEQHDELRASAVPRRRRYSAQFKQQLVDATCKAGASVSAIALAHGLNTNQLFKWRRQLLSAEAAATLLPVHVVESPTSALDQASARGSIEIRLRHASVRIEGEVAAHTVQAVLQSLR